MPKFGPTSNPELDALLDNLRNDHFMPVRLMQHDFRLMYLQINRTRLLSNPLTVNVGGENFTLTPKSVPLGVPRKKLVQALGLMKEPSDFDVIPELLRGYNEMSVGQSQLGQVVAERMARLVGKAGRTDILMYIARNADKLLFKFTATTARMFVRGLYLKQKRALEERGVLAVLADTNGLLTLVGKREICMDQEKRLSQDDVVLGVVLAIFTDFSLKYRSGEDHEGTTKGYTLELKSAWAGPEPIKLNGVEDGVSLAQVKESVYRAKNQVSTWEPVLEGLLQAKSILKGSELSPWLEKTSEELAGDVAHWGEFIEKNSPAIWPLKK